MSPWAVHIVCPSGMASRIQSFWTITVVGDSSQRLGVACSIRTHCPASRHISNYILRAYARDIHQSDNSYLS